MYGNYLLMYLNWREICPLRMPKTCSASFQVVVSYGKRVRFAGPCHRTANLGLGLWTFRNRPSILQAHTIDCVWERRTSMFPVLDTNLWSSLMLLFSATTLFPPMDIKRRKQGELEPFVCQSIFQYKFFFTIFPYPPLCTNFMKTIS